MARPPEARPGRWRLRLWTVEALVLLVCVRVALRLLPFRWVRRWQRRAARVRETPWPDPLVPLLARRVERASRFLPGDETCLAQAMVAQVLIARAGHRTELRIGVERPAPGADPRGRPLLAHAWLEGRGTALIGAPEPGRYTPLED